VKGIFLLPACLAIVSLSVQSEDLYRWIDSAGVVHYSDLPSADAEKIDAKKFSSEVSVGEDLPYESQRAQQNFPVILYVSSGCGEACDKARSLLNKRGIPFREKVLQTKEDIEALKQLSGIDGFVPVLAVGKNYLKGFLEPQWESELDMAGYPKFAPYRAPGPPAANKVVPATPAAQ